ncbi:uncharacterized protein LOC108677489 [Hyalella azteca]|uniref:Uncharacterized protein LOC108677489 n=1 Tax=Hyalella azteca TaxID=294128 RepID=A0A8B7P7S5_HYAAZ|nr:uncharacterized protein LOC108677489 [Hyalella azteca]
MFGKKGWHVINAITCALGLAAWPTFYELVDCDVAVIWSFISGVLALICLIQELLQHNDLLHVCHSQRTLRGAQVVALLCILACLVLTVLHFTVAYFGEEDLKTESYKFNDYLVGISTFVTLTCACKLLHSSRKCHKKLVNYQLLQRPESPHFISGGAVPYQQLDPPGSISQHGYSGTRYQQLDQPGSVSQHWYSDTRRLQPTEDTCDGSADTEGESVADMDRLAEELNGSAAARGPRLVGV